MDVGITERLRCPVCRAGLSSRGRTLRCGTGHSFDLARQGYVDLADHPITHEGDSAAMIAARGDVLAAGHFAFLTDALVDALRPYPAGLVLDVGAGTGHHLAALLDARPDDFGLAIDVSKPALRRAARAHPRLGAVRADVWHGLPVADGVASAVLNIFAPRSGAEFARVLAPEAPLVVVTPGADHLRELPLTVRVDPTKDERLRTTLAPWFECETERRLQATLRLSAAEATAVLAMGPSARHPRAETQVPAGTVTADVRLSLWLRKR